MPFSKELKQRCLYFTEKPKAPLSSPEVRGAGHRGHHYPHLLRRRRPLPLRPRQRPGLPRRHLPHPPNHGRRRLPLRPHRPGLGRRSPRRRASSSSAGTRRRGHRRPGGQRGGHDRRGPQAPGAEAAPGQGMASRLQQRRDPGGRLRRRRRGSRAVARHRRRQELRLLQQQQGGVAADIRQHPSPRRPQEIPVRLLRHQRRGEEGVPELL